MSSSCTFDETDWEAFPYAYYNESGGQILSGISINVSGYNRPVCVFNDSICATSGSTCCSTTSSLDDESNASLYVLIAFIVPYVLCTRGLSMYNGRKVKRLKAEGKTDEEIASYMNDSNPFQALGAAVHSEKSKACADSAAESAESAASYSPAVAAPAVPDGDKTLGLAPTNGDGDGTSPAPAKRPNPCIALFFMLLMMGVMASIIMEATIMPKSIQQNMPPVDRAAQLAMASFLTPVKEIFQFLEDAMTIKVGYALAAGRLHELNILLHVSVLGGALCALVAFGLMVAVANTSVAAAVLNPSAVPNDALIASGCTLIPTTDELLLHARAYWLLISGAWLPNFVTKGLNGFFLGTRRWGAYFFPTIINGVVPLVIWFAMLPAANGGDTNEHGGGLTPLSVLGIAYGTADWLNMAAFFGYFACSSELRSQYKLRFLLWRGRGLASDGWATVRSVLSEGLQLMVVDLAVQLSLTVTIYVAASQRFELAYKLAAVQAAYWTMGPSYLIGLMLMLKMLGAQLISYGKHKAFANFFCLVLAYTVCLATGAVLISILKRDPLAYDFGQSACLFATNEHCAPVYAAIFDREASRGGDSLAAVFVAFGPTVGLQMLFILLRAGLSTCHDFGFMARSSCACVVVVFVPAILVARYVVQSAVAYYVAAYAPHFALIVVFGVRMASHLRALFRGLDGPWTAHMHKTRQSMSAGGGPGLAAAAVAEGEDGLAALQVSLRHAE